MNMDVICETGPPAYRPYLRRLESLTIADVMDHFRDAVCLGFVVSLGAQLL